MPRRMPVRDPRTVARDIPGILDIIFPRLSGGLVAALNRKMFHFNSVTPLDESLVALTFQQKSMLFEIAVAHAELAILSGTQPSLSESVRVAAERQRQHFDAKPPHPLSWVDEAIVTKVSTNLTQMLSDFVAQRRSSGVTVRPLVPGFGWIGSGSGDFAIDDILVEVKNTDRNFTSNDYRQILMYWCLSYSKGIETGASVWSKYLLINPRLNRSVFGAFDDLIEAGSGGLSRVEVHEYLRTIVTTSSEVRK